MDGRNLRLSFPQTWQRQQNKGKGKRRQAPQSPGSDKLKISMGRLLSSHRFLQFFTYLNRQTLRQTMRAATARRLPGLAAEMAYSAMLSFFPAILALLTAIGLFRPLQVIFATLTSQLSEVMPTDALRLIQTFAAVNDSSDRGLFSFSFVLALGLASGALSAAMAAFDQIHQLPRQQMRSFWQSRIIALGLTIGTILLLLSALTLMLVSDIAIHNLAYHSGVFQPELLRLWRLLFFPLVLAILSLTFGLLYRYGPSRRHLGQPVMPGAVIAAVLWALISSLFRHYVRHFGNYNQVYGTVGAVIVLMLWLYLSSLMLLIGYQLNVTVGAAMRANVVRVNAGQAKVISAEIIQPKAVQPKAVQPDQRHSAS